jgi:hypothetical protein
MREKIQSWPSLVNHDCLEPYSYREGSGIITEENDAGSPKTRQRSTDVSKYHTFDMEFTLGEWEIIKSFVRFNLRGGALTFEFPIPNTKYIGEMRLIVGEESGWFTSFKQYADTVKITISMEEERVLPDKERLIGVATTEAATEKKRLIGVAITEVATEKVSMLATATAEVATEKERLIGIATTEVATEKERLIGEARREVSTEKESLRTKAKEEIEKEKATMLATARTEVAREKERLLTEAGAEVEGEKERLREATIQQAKPDEEPTPEPTIEGQE